MSDKVLVFGNLDDILTVKLVEITSLRKEILIEDEAIDGDYSFCEVHCNQHDCDGCPVDMVCKVNVKIKAILRKIVEIEKEKSLIIKEQLFIKNKSLP